MVISFGTVTHEGTLGRHLHRRVEHGEVSETDSSRSIGFQFISLIPFFFGGIHNVLIPVKKEEGKSASVRLTCSKC